MRMGRNNRSSKVNFLLIIASRSLSHIEVKPSRQILDDCPACCAAQAASDVAILRIRRPGEITAVTTTTLNPIKTTNALGEGGTLSACRCRLYALCSSCQVGFIACIR